jgi:hypothetical protein
VKLLTPVTAIGAERDIGSLGNEERILFGRVAFFLDANGQPRAH